MRRLIVVFLAITPVFLFGQGAFLAQGASGVGVDFAHSTADNFSITGLNFGYSFRGNVDLALAYSRSYGEEIKLISISSYLTFHAAKKSFISTAITIAYLHGVFSDPTSNSQSRSMNAVAVGGDIFTHLVRNKVVHLVPSIGMTYSIFIRKRQYYYYDNFYSTSVVSSATITNNTSFAFGMSIVLRPESKAKIVLDTSFVTDDENDSFIFGLGFVIPTSKIDD